MDNFVGMPGWFGAGGQPYRIWITHTPGGEIVANSMGASLEADKLVSYSGDSISMYTHSEPTSIPSTILNTTKRT